MQQPPSGVGLPQPQSIRAIFFDAGFTLLAPHPSIAEIIGKVALERDLPLTHECLEAQLPAAEALLRSMVREDPSTWSDDRSIEAIWSAYYLRLLRPCLPDATEEEVASHVRAILSVFDEGATYALYPDVLPVLDALRAQTQRHFTLGIISDWGTSLALIMRHHDLVRYFDFAVISATVRYAKPHPELFATALRRADAIPDYALHIGDSYVLDVLGARAVGITPVLLDRPGRVDPARVDCTVVRDLYGLLDALEVPRP